VAEVAVEVGVGREPGLGLPLPLGLQPAVVAQPQESRPELLLPVRLHSMALMLVRKSVPAPEPLPELHCWPAPAVSCSHRQEAGLPRRAEE
jgi:hypothetical protein